MTDVLGDDTEFSELVDAIVPRVDLVGKPANGSSGFLLMKQDAQAGLMPPDAIRDLIGKTAEPIPQEETVTMTGSPGAIAKLMHEAAVRARQRDKFEKAKYDTEDRKRMAGNGQAMDDGSYPIADEADLDDAIHAVGRGGADHDAIRRHVIARAKALGASSKIPDDWAADGSLKEVTKMAVTGELDDGVDGMDPTVVLAEPGDDMDAPGDMNEPGSPAWEAIDAATARKWCSIAVRLRNALCVMAEREMLEAASVDPDDAMAAWDLQDAECALDYVIDTLAGFAVEEQAEAELAGEAMGMVGKALAGFDPAALDTFEALAPVAKAGRVLSTANEAAIRGAVDSLQKVLASLPPAPSTDDVAKTANEESDMPEPTLSEDTTAASGQEPAMGVQQAAPKPVAEQAVTDMAKADADKKMVAVYNAKGVLVGIVDPEKITMIEGAEADDEGPSGSAADDAGMSDESDAPETTDLTPEPPAEAGIPADAVPADDADITKSTNETDTTPEEVLKSIVDAKVAAALADYRATQEQAVAKQADDRAQLAELVEMLKGRVQALEEQPAESRVFTNGVNPPRDLRGMDRGAFSTDVTKALDRRRSLYTTADATEQNRLANEMQQDAISMLREIQRG